VPDRGYRRRHPVNWALLASLLVHITVAAGLVLLPGAPHREARQPMPISVEILTPKQLETLFGPQPGDPVALQPPSPAEPDSETSASTEPVVIRAETLLSGAVLADPRSAQARNALPGIARAERMEQLCNLEAMEQLHAWRAEFEPDRLVAYAASDTVISGATVVADGGAIRSRFVWYRIKYKCALTPDYAAVVAFEFQLGDPIPRREWDELNLPPVY
jgi:hypothetical protein